MRLSVILILPALLVVSTSFAQRTAFSGSNAEAIMRALVLEIGPRPMGSPSEHRALAFAVRKFKEYGCDTSYILPFTIARGVNTRSGVAIGVKRGNTGRIIVIGGHIDSSGPDVPGANDNASGSACVIELARVIVPRNTESTVLFCCWGGEETGLNGSQYFVDQYPLIDSVALMLQIDMADGASFLTADPDGEKASAPAWLLKAAFDEFYNTLQYEGLEYQTASAALNSALGAFGSDHIPFINRGIPAIDFTSDVAFPIHTQLDKWENFTFTGLQRSGDLVLRLFERFDGGVPSRTNESYHALQIGSMPIVLSFPVLWSIILLSLVLAVGAFVVTRKRRTIPDPTAKIRWSGVKVLFGALLLQGIVWSSESIIGLFTGYRFGWVGNGWGYVVAGIFAGGVGLWFLLRLQRRFRLTPDAFVYERVALILLVVFVVLAAFATPRLGAFLAGVLFLIALSFISQKPFLKVLFFCGATVGMLRLLFFETFTLLQRGIVQSTPASWGGRIGLEAVLFAACVIVTLPLVYALVAVYRGSGKEIFLLKHFKSPRVFGASVAGLVVCGGYLSIQEPYHTLWNSVVRVEQNGTAGGDSLLIEITGSEPLRKLAGIIGGKDTLLDVNSYHIQFARTVPEAAAWVTVSSSSELTTQATDTTTALSRHLELLMPIRPLRVEVSFTSDQPFDVTSPWAQDARARGGQQKVSDKHKRFVWYAFPDSHLFIPVTFTLADSQKIFQDVQVTFDSLVYPLRLKRDLTSVSYRTIMTARDSFSASSLPHASKGLAAMQQQSTKH